MRELPFSSASTGFAKSLRIFAGGADNGAMVHRTGSAIASGLIELLAKDGYRGGRSETGRQFSVRIGGSRPTDTLSVSDEAKQAGINRLAQTETLEPTISAVTAAPSATIQPPRERQPEALRTPPPPIQQGGSSQSGRSRGDVNNDGIVDDADLTLVIQGMGQKVATADVTGDGVVDDKDSEVVLNNFGEQITRADNSRDDGGVSKLTGDLSGDGVVDDADLTIAIIAARNRDLSGDVNGDGRLDQSDLQMLLDHYGRTV